MFSLKKVGRPTKADYRAKQLRFGKVEDAFLVLIQSIENEKDKRLVEQTLERLKPVSTL